MHPLGCVWCIAFELRKSTEIFDHDLLYKLAEAKGVKPFLIDAVNQVATGWGKKNSARKYLTKAK